MYGSVILEIVISLYGEVMLTEGTVLFHYTHWCFEFKEKFGLVLLNLIHDHIIYKEIMSRNT